MKQPQVSVIVPVYNAKSTIESCLASIRRQSLPRKNFEIIIVDDGSTDGTSALLKRKRGLTVITHKGNRGPAAAQNTGIGQSKGEYIAFVDADCTVPATWLERILPYFENGTVAGVGVYQNPLVEDTRFAEHLLSLGRIQFRNHATKDLIVKRPPAPQDVDAIPKAGALYKKQSIDEAGGFDESLPSGEDIDLCWAIKKQGGNLLLVPDAHVNHALRPTLTTFLRQQYWYGRGIPHLFAKHPIRMKHLFAFYPALILALVLHPLLLILAALPLLYYAQDIKGKSLRWSLEHLAIAYLKTIANIAGILRETPNAFLKNP